MLKELPGFHFVLANMEAIAQAIETGNWPDTLVADVQSHLDKWCGSHLAQTPEQAQGYMVDLLTTTIGAIALSTLKIFRDYDNEEVCCLLFGATDEERPDVSMSSRETLAWPSPWLF